MSDKKRATGQYYTRGNPFAYPAFRRWAARANLKSECVLEPFAGANHIINNLTALGLCKNFNAFDLSPNDSDVKKRDTIKKFPSGYNVCVTNPPWLARNSATRRKLPYPVTEYDDVYKHCLKLCLDNCGYVAALVPASFLHSNILRNRLSAYILLHEVMFNDTENPVCLALFNDKPVRDTLVYFDKKRIGKLTELEKYLPPVKSKRNARVRFNDPHGQLGFISFDNTAEPTIRFCRASEIKSYAIKESSRFITRISGEFNCNARLIKHLNETLKNFRESTQDVFLTPFKGIRKDGYYRRRLDFNLARRIINAD